MFYFFANWHNRCNRYHANCVSIAQSSGQVRFLIGLRRSLEALLSLKEGVKMTTKSIRDQQVKEATGDQLGAEIVLDMQTIRTRVQRIKKSWNDQTRQQRAQEGILRRAELERLLGQGSACSTSTCSAEPVKSSQTSTMHSLRLFSNAV